MNQQQWMSYPTQVDIYYTATCYTWILAERHISEYSPLCFSVDIRASLACQQVLIKKKIYIYTIYKRAINIFSSWVSAWFNLKRRQTDTTLTSHSKKCSFFFFMSIIYNVSKTWRADQYYLAWSFTLTSQLEKRKIKLGPAHTNTYTSVCSSLFGYCAW